MFRKLCVDVSDLFWLNEQQMARLKPLFPSSHGKSRVDDHRVLNGINVFICNGFRLRDVLKQYDPHKTI